MADRQRQKDSPNSSPDKGVQMKADWYKMFFEGIA